MVSKKNDGQARRMKTNEKVNESREQCYLKTTSNSVHLAATLALHPSCFSSGAGRFWEKQVLAFALAATRDKATRFGRHMDKAFVTNEIICYYYASPAMCLNVVRANAMAPLQKTEIFHQLAPWLLVDGPEA